MNTTNLSSSRNNRRYPPFLVAAAMLALSGASFGQADAKTDTKPAADEPVLKGPTVKERSVPGVVNTFGDGQAARRMGERIPPEVLREALGVLTSDDATEDIRATDDQREEFRTVTDRFRAAMRSYLAEHREELIDLRREANLSGRAAQEIDRAIGRRPGPRAESDRQRSAPETRERDMESMAEDSMGEASQEKQDAARQRIREIMAGGPRIEDVMTRIWEGLSPAQREAVDTKLDEYREREAQRREEMYVRQQMGDRAPEAQRAPAANDDMMTMTDSARPARPDRAPAANAGRRERLLRLFERLSPEQQEALLERLENASRDGAFGQGRPGRPQRRAAEKPAPTMDEVEVPRPEDVQTDRPQKPERRRERTPE